MKDIVFAGLWFRHDNRFGIRNVVFSAGCYIGMVRMEYSYDFPVFGSSSFLNLGAHEVTLIAHFPYKDSRKRKMKAIKCSKI